MSERHLTRLKAITKEGDILLVTDDRAVQDKALAADDELKSFVYWTGKEEEIVTGRVVATLPSEPFEFAVLPEEAIGGP
jgi:hypothetical protein